MAMKITRLYPDSIRQIRFNQWDNHRRLWDWWGRRIEVGLVGTSNSRMKAESACEKSIEPYTRDLNPSFINRNEIGTFPALPFDRL